ncbi:MAG: S8 family peptidase [Thermoanaerobaculum sp.]
MTLIFVFAVALQGAPGQVPALVPTAVWQQAQGRERLELLVLFRSEKGVEGFGVPPQAGWEREAEVLASFRQLGVVVVRVPAALLADLASDPRVHAVSPTFRVRALRKEGKALIRAGDVQRLGFTGAGVGVAVLDTGVDDGHPELAPGGTAFGSKTVRLLDAVDGDGNPRDEEGHGTRVAGIAAGGGGGVAPGATVVAVRVLDAQGEGTSEQILAGLEAVLASVRAGNPFRIRVVNLSLGGYDKDLWPPGSGSCDDQDPVMAEVFRKLEDAGVLPVAAAGNGGCTRGVAWPACLSSVLAVGAVYDDELCFDPLPLPFGCLMKTASFGQGQCMASGCSDETKKDRIACYSDSGDKLGVWAPAHCAKTTKKGGGYDECFGGTSAASPYVAGAAALLFEAFPYALPAAVREALATTGNPRQDGRNGITRRRVDVAAAYAVLAATCSAPAPPQSLRFSPPLLCGKRVGLFSWVPVAGAERYRVHAAFVPDFRDAWETVVEQPEVAVSAPPGSGAQVYLRVRAETSCAASGWVETTVPYAATCPRPVRRRLSP